MDSLLTQDDFELDVAGKNSGCEESDSSSEDEVLYRTSRTAVKKYLMMSLVF